MNLGGGISLIGSGVLIGAWNLFVFLSLCVVWWWGYCRNQQRGNHMTSDLIISCKGVKCF